MRAPSCAPTATISVPSLATWSSVWLMPRPPGATVNSLPARLAGGNPSDAVDGVGLVLPLFAPEITTTATPRMIMARIGTPTLVSQPRKWSAARNSADQFRLAGCGRKERTRVAHSVLAAAPRCASAARRRSPPRWLAARESRGRWSWGRWSWGRWSGGAMAGAIMPNRSGSMPNLAERSMRWSNSKPGTTGPAEVVSWYSDPEGSARSEPEPAGLASSTPAGPASSNHGCDGTGGRGRRTGGRGRRTGGGWLTVEVYLNRLPCSGGAGRRRPGRRGGRGPAG
jgi:hypothetical protein